MDCIQQVFFGVAFVLSAKSPGGLNNNKKVYGIAAVRSKKMRTGYSSSSGSPDWCIWAVALWFFLTRKAKRHCVLRALHHVVIQQGENKDQDADHFQQLLGRRYQRVVDIDGVCTFD